MQRLHRRVIPEPSGLMCIGGLKHRLKSTVAEQKPIRRLAEWLATNVMWLGQEEFVLGGLKGTVFNKLGSSLRISVIFFSGTLPPH